MGGHVFGVGFARQAVAVAVGAPDQEDKVKGRVGSVRQFALLTRIEDTKSLRLLKIVQFFECCVSIGPNAPPLQIAGQLGLEHIGQEKDADDACIVADLGANAMGHIHKHARTGATTEAANHID